MGGVQIDFWCSGDRNVNHKLKKKTKHFWYHKTAFIYRPTFGVTTTLTVVEKPVYGIKETAKLKEMLQNYNTRLIFPTKIS